MTFYRAGRYTGLYEKTSGILCFKKDAEAAGWVTWKGNLADGLIFASYDPLHTFCEITQ
jgi:hypothetical protein